MDILHIDYSNPVNILVFSTLIIFSLMTWSLIFSTLLDFLKFRKNVNNQKSFINDYQSNNSILLKDLFLKKENHLIGHFYQSISNKKMTKTDLKQLWDLFLDEQEQKRMSGLSWFATIANVSPYVGLLGTLWGIMQTFSILGQEAAGISQLAPGLAEALQATALGLLVAIPAHIAYNKFVSSYRTCLGELSRQGNYLL